ncbi:DoxX family protein [Saccharopolyspora sp. TS4A08]|uniref:DoxX family protein n=1 Tax=Saccharopolyspora ipomoeae TaxID=3042027 RepID=A0ABT6PTN9_9PSEU|nr:DoxX family protein [Saccharopolyspora sp. TS4A08]MDI2031368.1 DoxX family protein [Saccharopolyspora sp. TS4A08]
MAETRAENPGNRGSIGTAGTIVLWVLQALLAVVFVMAAVPKFLGDPTMVATFEAVGVGQWLRYVTGVVEIAGAIGLLVPRFTGPAALGLVGVMIGATVTNLLTAPPIAVVTVVLGALLALVAWRRWSSVRVLLGR